MKKGLVLEGGGFKGSYQIGAYYALKDCGIKINGFVGTSIGSINAAVLACGFDKKLLEYWYNVNPGNLLGFDERFSNSFNGKVSMNSVLGAFATFKDIIINMGITDEFIRSIVNELVSYKALINSSKDFGLVTCNISKMKPKYVYKEDIQDQEDLVNHIVASCYLPVFKQKKVIDDSYYVDGGFYDNSPVKLLADLNYDMAYVIDIHGIGFKRKEKYNVKTVLIEPSRKNGSILELNKSVIRDNILMGYYDTLRIIKKYYGFKYCFKKRGNWYFKFIIRNVKKWDMRRVMNFFSVDNVKDLVIKSLEYVMEKENFNYYKVYTISECIRKFENNKKKHFVYVFVSKLKFL